MRLIDVNPFTSTDLSVQPADRINGTVAGEFIDGTGNGDKISGLDGDDIIYGEGGDDTLLGGDGNDTLRGGVGSDRLNGGLGFDRAMLDFGGSGVSIDISAFQAGKTFVIDDGQGGHDTLTNIEKLWVFGTSGADTIIGSAEADTISTSGGADLVKAGAGNDTINDFTHSGDTAPAKILGGDGDDFLSVTSSSFSALAKFNGGAGNDTLALLHPTYGGAVLASLVDGVASITSGETISIHGTSVENLVVHSGSGADSLSGGDGVDSLDGGAGADSISGGGGDDRLAGDAGDDSIDGGDGHDLYWVSTNNADSVMLDYSRFDVSGGDVTVDDGQGGHDQLHSIEGVYLQDTGYQTNDTLIGSRGGDYLEGYDGSDLLKGGFGDDTIYGGNGHDRLSGGAGVDTFIFQLTSDSTPDAADLIVGLTDDDVIDLSKVDANARTAGDDAFSLVSAFDHHAGQAVLSYDAETKLTFVQLDVDGDAQADMVIALKGDHHDFTNFVL